MQNKWQFQMNNQYGQIFVLQLILSMQETQSKLKWWHTQHTKQTIYRITYMK